MAAQGNLVLANGEGTPVNKTFSSRGKTSDQSGQAVFKWQDITSGIAIGFPTITFAMRESASKYDVDKRIMTPVLETISGDAGGYTPAPKIAYTLMSREQFVLPVRSTTAQRKDLLAFSKNLNDDAVIESAVWNLESVW
jgi:hypothetical protein